MTQEHYLAMASLPTGAIGGWMIFELIGGKKAPGLFHWLVLAVWSVGIIGILGLAK